MRPGLAFAPDNLRGRLTAKDFAAAAARKLLPLAAAGDEAADTDGDHRPDDARPFIVDPSYSLSLNTLEVAAAFEVPLAFLMNPVNHELRAREVRGRMRRFYAMPWDGRDIWGATAGMIRALYERVYGR